MVAEGPDKVRFSNGDQLWNFHTVCDEHDRCYGRCGAERAQCDDTMRVECLRQCEAVKTKFASHAVARVAAWFREQDCNLYANAMHLALEQGGAGPFEDAQEALCTCPQTTPDSAAKSEAQGEQAQAVNSKGAAVENGQPQQQQTEQQPLAPKQQQQQTNEQQEEEKKPDANGVVLEDPNGPCKCPDKNKYRQMTKAASTSQQGNLMVLAETQARLRSLLHRASLDGKALAAGAPKKKKKKKQRQQQSVKKTPKAEEEEEEEQGKGKKPQKKEKQEVNSKGKGKDDEEDDSAAPDKGDDEQQGSGAIPRLQCEAYMRDSLGLSAKCIEKCKEEPQSARLFAQYCQ